MNKILVISVLTAGIVIASAIYYFFGVRLTVINQTDNIQSFFVFCRNGGGKTWEYQSVEQNSSESKVLFMSSGDRLACSFNVGKLPSKESLVIGYFEESISSIEMTLKSEGDDVIILIESISSGARFELDRIIF